MIWQLRDLIKQKTVMLPLGKLANWDFVDLEKIIRKSSPEKINFLTERLFRIILKELKKTEW